MCHTLLISLPLFLCCRSTLLPVHFSTEVNQQQAGSIQERKVEMCVVLLWYMEWRWRKLTCTQTMATCWGVSLLNVISTRELSCVCSAVVVSMLFRSAWGAHALMHIRVFVYFVPKQVVRVWWGYCRGNWSIICIKSAYLCCAYDISPVCALQIKPLLQVCDRNHSSLSVYIFRCFPNGCLAVYSAQLCGTLGSLFLCWRWFFSSKTCTSELPSGFCGGSMYL